LGSYVVNFNWRGHQADLKLTTIKGSLLLTGKGTVTHGRLQFSGLAQAQEGQEEDLAGLLSLLGQRRPGAGKNVIALEFK
jgi:general secretion pathway protein N